MAGRASGEPARPERNGGSTAASAKRMPAGFREPPNNLELEQLLLGSVIVNQDSASRVRAYLKPEHFYEPRHARIFEAVTRVNGRLFDYVQLGPEFNQAEEFRELGGAEYITKLAEVGSVYRADQADEFARELIELSSRRHLIDVAQETLNRAFDLSIPESIDDQIKRVRGYIDSLAREAPTRSSYPCDLPSLDWTRVANEEPPAERWLIAEWIPLGTSGIVTGPGASGKSFLELLRLICIATGTRFLGFEVEPVPCLAYFAEDSDQRLWSRVAKICRGLQIDPNRLLARLEIVSTVGAHRHLIMSEHNSPTTTPTEWFHRVHDRARAIGARYIAFDHVGRYLAINRNDPNQVFSAFGHLDQLANSIDGSVGLLAHPSKTDMRAKAAKKDQGPIVSYVGGSAAMIDAPRWVEVLDSVKSSDGEKFRVLTNEKQNYSRRFAIKLVENDRGIVEAVGEVDPDNPAVSGRGFDDQNSSRSGGRGPKSNADRTLMALEEMFHTYHREIPLDDLVRECVRRGIITEAIENSNAWRDRRKLVRRHINEKIALVDIRTSGLGEFYALKP